MRVITANLYFTRLFIYFAICVIFFIGTKQSFAALAIDQLITLDVVVNGTNSGTWLMLEHAGAFYAPREAFDDWRVKIDQNSTSIIYRGQQYWALSEVLGYKAKLIKAEQSLELFFSPTVFTQTKITQGISQKPILAQVLPSAFFNYDLNFARSELRDGPTIVDLGLLGELGFSNRWGVLTNSFAARNLTNESALGVPSRNIRLETTFTHDFPDQNKTLRLGDSVTRIGLLGRNVYYGGIQIGSNFSLSPGFVTQPVPVLNGFSATPSTVELYINDVLRQTSTVPTGPFAINNLPTLVGNGDARIVVRDQLGRETVIDQSFFSNSQLLAEGLNDFSIEAGSVRQDLGLSNGQYGPTFASGTWRHGYNSLLTLESRTELTANLKTFQVGALAIFPFNLLGSAALTTSHEDSAGNGQQWLLGLSHQTLNSSTFLQAQGASEDFRQLGQLDNFSSTKLQLVANWTRSFNRFGNVGVGFASIQRYNALKIDTYSANYSVQLDRQTTLSLNANRVQGDAHATSVGLNLIFLLGKNRVAGVTANTREGVNDLYGTFSQNQDANNNLGLRALVGEQQGNERQEAGLYYFGQHAIATADISRTRNQTALRLGANGGLVMAEGHIFATQRLLDSFALVEVKNYGNIGVGIGSNFNSLTDTSGIAMIPRLTPYQNNQIRLKADDLPINAEIDTIEQYAVPAYRSAVKVMFPVRSGRGALVKILFDDGDFAPAGAIVHVEGDKQEFYVARRGEAFITGLQDKNLVSLVWKDQQCTFAVTLPIETPDEFPRIGPLICKEVNR